MKIMEFYESKLSKNAFNYSLCEEIVGDRR